jgi:hypothetical protein
MDLLAGPHGLQQYVRAFRNYASSFQLDQQQIGALQATAAG